jgi:hypothetical protein
MEVPSSLPCAYIEDDYLCIKFQDCSTYEHWVHEEIICLFSSHRVNEFGLPLIVGAKFDLRRWMQELGLPRGVRWTVYKVIDHILGRCCSKIESEMMVELLYLRSVTRTINLTILF